MTTANSLFDDVALEVATQKYDVNRESLKSQLQYDFYRNMRSLILANGREAELFSDLPVGLQIKRIDEIINGLEFCAEAGHDSINVSRNDLLINPLHFQAHIGTKYGLADVIHGFSNVELSQGTVAQYAQHYGLMMQAFSLRKHALDHNMIVFFRQTQKRMLAKEKFAYENDRVVELEIHPSVLGMAALKNYKAISQ